MRLIGRLDAEVWAQWELDELVYALYDLTDEEKAIVSGTTKITPRHSFKHRVCDWFSQRN
jgi:hypothetical protein